MTSKEKIELIKDCIWFGCEKDGIDVRDLINEIDKDLEILEEIRNEIKVIDYGEEYQNRYAIQYIERGQIVIVELCKEDYNKWNRWLNNDK